MLEERFDSENSNKEDKQKFEDIQARYKKVSEEHGSEIKGVHYITRSEPFPSLYENADFSLGAIKNSIKDGETKTHIYIMSLPMNTSIIVRLATNITECEVYFYDKSHSTDTYCLSICM
jgi:hypothetical protein